MHVPEPICILSSQQGADWGLFRAGLVGRREVEPLRSKTDALLERVLRDLFRRIAQPPYCPFPFGFWLGCEGAGGFWAGGCCLGGDVWGGGVGAEGAA